MYPVDCVDNVYTGDLMRISAFSSQCTVNMRMAVPTRTLIDRAADVLGKNRTDFIQEAATARAETVLLDRTLFKLSARGFKRFSEVLDAPLTKSSPALKLLCRKSPWDAD